MPKRFTKEEFIKRAKNIYGDKYDYSKVKYVNNQIKVCVVCSEHGEFFTFPCHFLRGHECPKCGIQKNASKKRKSIEKFISDAKNVHGNRYDYSKTEYINNKTKVCIICPEHGEFWQCPLDHLKGSECPECAKEVRGKKQVLSLSEFITKAVNIHGNKYDYSKVEYKNSKDKVCIICPEHGEFWQSPHEHLSGCGCKDCANKRQSEKLKSNTFEFITKAKKIHGDKYVYDKTKYVNSHTKLLVRCRKHGLYEIMPYSHLNGVGCSMCNESKLEKDIKTLLENKKLEFIEHYKNKNILGRQHLDFYIPQYNIAIECQGEQHFKPVKWFGGSEAFNTSKKRDKLKIEKCKENGIKLYHYFEDKRYFGTYQNEIHSIEELEKVLMT